MSKVVIESWLPKKQSVDLGNGVEATEVTVSLLDDPVIHATPVESIPTELEAVLPDIRVREVHIPGTKGDKGDKFKFEDFTEADIQAILVTQPPLDPSPVELFDSILNEVP